MSEANREVWGVDPQQGAGPRSPGLDEVLARLDRARVPADLFGDDEAEAARHYRTLARLVHPDATGRPHPRRVHQAGRALARPQPG